MTISQIKPGIHYVGSNHWDRKFFDELIFLPNGTSYNSYLICGSEKTCLVDAVDFDKEYEIFEKLKTLNVKKIDYFVVNHSEQDHSGAFWKLLDMYPEAKIVTNAKCKDMLINHILAPENRVITINDNNTLSLGDKTLQFIIAPWVHWPDTMFTYVVEDKVLLTCDFLGAHYATSDLFVQDEHEIYVAAKRYFAEIMMPFRSNIKKHLERIKDIPVDIIGASHGPLYEKPEFIINAYKEWASDDVKDIVVLPYVSMHGSTKKMVEYFIEALSKRSIQVRPYNLRVSEVGDIAMDLIDAATIVIGTPTVLTGAHPLAVQTVYLANLLRPKTRFASLICSYGWGGKVAEQITGMMSNMKVDVLEPVIAKGYPKEQDFASLDRLADDILKKHKEAGLVK